MELPNLPEGEPLISDDTKKALNDCVRQLKELEEKLEKLGIQGNIENSLISTRNTNSVDPLKPEKPIIDTGLQHLYADILQEKKKSIWKAYFFWLIGGIFGVHHFYLRRDRQAFICWSTFGGYIIGWLGDILNIPEMVRDTNEDPKFIEKFKEQLRQNRRPPFSVAKFCMAIMVGYLWAQIFMLAIPESEHLGINWKMLNWLVPFVIAVGVWTVGNCGREQGKIKHCLIAAYCSYPIRYIVYDETYWLTAVVIISCLAFDHYSKEWLLTPPKRRSFKRRVVTLYFCGVIYLSMFGSFFYFNGKITNSEGEEVPVYEALSNIFKSSLWTDLKQSMGEMWQFAQHHGWRESWKQIVDLMDADGEQNAYKVLGLSPTASQSEITTTFRRLSKENHPDKVKGEAEKRAAQDRFMEISQAYEILSKLKSKRRTKNKMSTVDDDHATASGHIEL